MSKITLIKLAENLDKLTGKVDVLSNKLDTVSNTVDNLAASVKNSFDYMTVQFVEVRSDISGLKSGQEEIKLRLDQHAYSFEVKDLKYRVDKIEKKIGIK